MENIIVCPRRHAKHSIITIIILILFILAPIGVGIYYYFFDSAKQIIRIIILILLSMISLFCLASLPLSIILVIRNNKNLTKPILIYNEEKDVFIGYDCYHGFKEITIKNEDLKNISFLSLAKSKEVIIRLENNGKIKKYLLGFCLPTDVNDIKQNLNKYLKTPIQQ